MVKLKFAPLFAKLEQKWKEERRNDTVEVFPCMRSGISRFHAG
jgi:hypothetical protein